MDQFTKQEKKRILLLLQEASRDASVQLDKRSIEYAKQAKSIFESTGKANEDQKAAMRRYSRINAKIEVTEGMREIQRLKSKGNRAEAKVYGMLEALWVKFKDSYNAGVYHADAKLNDGRKYEFFSYVLSGNLATFDPADTNPAYVVGDIFSTVGEKPVHVQIKGNGGVFKMAFSDAYLNNNQERLYKMFINNIPKIGSQKEFVNYFSDKFTRAFKENDLLIKHLEKGKNDRQDVKIKKAIMKSYIDQTGDTTKWYAFFVNGTQSQSTIQPKTETEAAVLGERMGMSFAVRSEKMVQFVGKNPKLFTVEMKGGQGKSKKVLQLRFDTSSIDATFSHNLWGLGSSSQAFLMNGIEKSYYVLRNKYEEKSKGFTKKYNAYVRPGGITSDGFIEVYETLFGELKFK